MRVGATFRFSAWIVSAPLAGGVAEDLYVTVTVPALLVRNGAGVAERTLEPTLAAPPLVVGVKYSQTTTPATGCRPASRTVSFSVTVFAAPREPSGRLDSG
jgi:hypothetical protein